MTDRSRKTGPLDAGPDALTLLRAAPVRPEVAEKLDELAEANRELASIEELATLPIGGVPAVVLPAGRSGWRWLLWWRELGARAFAAQGTAERSTLNLSLGSGQLWASDWEPWVADVAEELSGRAWAQPWDVTRIDLCADLRGWEPSRELADWTTRAKHRAQYDQAGAVELPGGPDASTYAYATGATTHHVGRKFTGLTFGRGGPCLARIYSKEEEQRARGADPWHADHWQNSPAGVWRVEFQLRRPILRELTEDRSTWPELYDAAPSIWQYLTTEWLVERDHDARRSRIENRPVTAGWEVVRTAWTTASTNRRPQLPANRVPLVAPPDVTALLKQALGCLLTAAKAEGQTPETPEQLLSWATPRLTVPAWSRAALDRPGRSIGPRPAPLDGRPEGQENEPEHPLE